MGKDNFWSELKIYVKEGHNVAEIYYGDRFDILKGLSKIVGEKGVVYGIDSPNYYRILSKKRELRNFGNVKLFKSTGPNFPSEVKNLDNLLIREFLWEYNPPSDETFNPKVFKFFSRIIKKRGNLLLNLSKTEGEEYLKLYNKSIRAYIPNFKKVFNSEDLVVYKKLK